MKIKVREDRESGCSMIFGLGSVVALAFSVILHNSLLWILIHMFFGWAYVVYALLVHFHELMHYFGM